MPAARAPSAHTVADFDFDLPPELIAQHPAPERSGSRLLDATGAAAVDRVFRDLPGREVEIEVGHGMGRRGVSSGHGRS